MAGLLVCARACCRTGSSGRPEGCPPSSGCAVWRRRPSSARRWSSR
ncbi:hypothetical protein NKG94_35930 [Micromonospora sp. M12]